MRTVRGNVVAGAVALAGLGFSGASSAEAAVGVFTPSIPVHTTSSTACVTVTNGGASYDPYTGAIVVKPTTVQFGGVSNCV